MLLFCLKHTMSFNFCKILFFRLSESYFQGRIKPKVCVDFLALSPIFASLVLLFDIKSSLTCYFVVFTKSLQIWCFPFFPSKGREYANFLLFAKSHRFSTVLRINQKTFLSIQRKNLSLLKLKKLK